MLERMPQQVSYLYILKPLEFLVLAGVATALAAAGHFVFSRWYRVDKTPRLSFIAFVAFVALALYLAVGIPMWLRADTYRKLTVMIYGVFIWAIPGGYFSYAFLNALATRSVKRLTWLDTSLPGVDDFLKAKELAAQGDIDGAVELYKTYPDKKAHALFAAAHLLEMNGRFREAADMFQQCAEHSGEHMRPWSEAVFRRAKLCEVNLDRMDKAVELYEMLVARAPSSELGRLASTKLTRLKKRSADEDAESPQAEG
jgi:tetratricopeptide (TPR) repeat protein